jgi:hypothetical protein
MHRLIVLCCALALAASSSRAYQQESKKLGLGIIIGAPTGFSMKYWNTGSTAIQGFLGGGYRGVAIGADYVYHTDAFQNRNAPFYYGPGLFFGQAGIGAPRYERNTLALGVRGVFGVDYIFPDHPFSIALELGPAMLLTPSINMGIELGVAFRFYP